VVSERRQLSSGLAALDALIGGGLEEGMSTLISGPPGTGKSSLAAQFVHAASERGEGSAMFLFEEARNNMLNRCSSRPGHGPLRRHRQRLADDPADRPGRTGARRIFAGGDEGGRRGARIVVIDSLNGYLNAMPDERFLTTHLHELLTYLGQRGVVSILVGVQQGMIGTGMTTSVDASYIADNVIMLRYFEAAGEVRQAISVFKKRGSAHERTIRRFQISTGGIRVGPVLKDFHGILTGVPTYDGDASEPAAASRQ
jgi:circadian clock protein KaiC